VGGAADGLAVQKNAAQRRNPMLIMELPPYKRPLLRVVARHMWDRSRCSCAARARSFWASTFCSGFPGQYSETENGLMEKQMPHDANTPSSAELGGRKKLPQQFRRPDGAFHRTGHRPTGF